MKAEITPRQRSVLTSIIEEYIKTARPVSSLSLSKKFDFGVCPATLRNEMYSLGEKGYLFQPYNSSGKIPTSKAYRFFVNRLLEKEEPVNFTKNFKRFFEEIDDFIIFSQRITREMAALTMSFTLTCLPKKKIFLEDGWERVIMEPEFQENQVLTRFIRATKRIKKKLTEIIYHYPSNSFEIFIGRENPFYKIDEFSFIICRLSLFSREAGIIVLGPKRMFYKRNINSVKAILRLANQLKQNGRKRRN